MWWYTCKYENIDPRNPTRLPLLFALDAKLKIPNGMVYQPQDDRLRPPGTSNIHFGVDFASTSFDGTTAGFGNGNGGGNGGGGCRGD